MQNIPANLISLIALAIVMLVALLILLLKNGFKRNFAKLTQQIQSNELLTIELQTQLSEVQQRYNESIKQLQTGQLENDQVTRQLEHRIKVLQQQLADQNVHIDQIQHKQPEDKLYTRAQKLVELGADINEIMRECDIPRAEAEMLMSLHRQKNS
jgi:cell division protein FtsX